MKRFVLSILFMAACLVAQAQQISVASFRLAENDLTAMTHGTEVKDQNGNTCALIKVETTQTGFTFDVGMMGVMKTEQHTGEIWVYVPFGVKRITIQHQQLGTLRDYYFPCSIEKGRTYIMQLTTGRVSTVIEEDLGGSYLMMTVEPKTATVYIDDQMKAVENGEVMLMLPYGRHTYRVESASYISESGVVEIGKERKELNVSLVSAQAELTVSCSDAQAELRLNGQRKGQGSWRGLLDEGMYVVEAVKEGHRTVKQSVTLGRQEHKTLTLAAPQPLYGRLNLTSSPGNCEVYLDGKLIGKSPDVFSDILVGEHTVELRREGYANNRKQIVIEEEKIVQLDFALDQVVANHATGALPGRFTINASGDQVYFSQGNLQYQASTNTWRFAEHQWDYVGDDNRNISSIYDGWIDLFGWGTSGYIHGAGCYRPSSTSNSYSNYYAYGSMTKNLYDETGKADWGYNRISNGGNTENQWRTLTGGSNGEWYYLFYTRSTASGIRYAKARLNGVNGVILVPDDWSTSTYTLRGTNSSGVSYTTNIISQSAWTGVLEPAGCVFLPAAGGRLGTSVNNAGSYGNYWSSSYDDSYAVYGVYFYDNHLYANSDNRFYGHSVRLVRLVK